MLQPLHTRSKPGRPLFPTVRTVPERHALLFLRLELDLDVLLPDLVVLHHAAAVVDLLFARLRLAHLVLQLELAVVALDVLPYVL